MTEKKGPGRWLTFLLGVFVVLTLGDLDTITGYEVSFSIFYLLPIIFVTWFAAEWEGFFICFMSAGTWMLADLSSGHRYSHYLIPVWNAGMRLLMFLLVSFLMHKTKKLLKEAQGMARIDFLTGIANARYFYERIGAEIERSRRFRRTFTVVYFDIDNFKQVNDTRGHKAGDALLRTVAQTLADTIRSIDLIARVGGDEFILLLPETGQEDAAVVIRRVLKKLTEVTTGHGWPVTFSAGAVICSQPVSRGVMEELIRMADNLMYAAKRSGKNAVLYRDFGEALS